MIRIFLCLALAFSSLLGKERKNLNRAKLVPWCIVPFDASKRNPEDRAKMLVRLGLKRSAYDWRSQQVEVTKRIKTMAYIATALAIMAVASTGYIGGWLMSNQDQISSTMDTTEDRFSKRISLMQNQSKAYAQKLTELGWTWKDGEWQQFGNKMPTNP